MYQFENIHASETNPWLCGYFVSVLGEIKGCELDYIYVFTQLNVQDY